MNNNNKNNNNYTCYHTINGLNDLLKGASNIINVNTTGKTTISIPESELLLIENTLNIARLFIINNPQLFQNPQDLLQKVEKGINIISAKTGPATASTKGASSNNNNICPNKIQSLKNLLEIFSIYP